MAEESRQKQQMRTLATMAWYQRLLSDLREECSPQILISALSAGLIVAILAIVAGTGVAALLFAGPLLPHIMTAIGIVLFGTVILLVVTALGSACRGSVTLPQEVPAVVTGIMAVTVFEDLRASMSLEAVVPLVVLAIATGTLFTGLFFLLLGRFRLGGLIRYIPFPVVGGVLAGLGWFLIQGGVSLVSGEGLHTGNIERLLDPVVFNKIAISFGFAFALLLISSRVRHYLVVPVVLVAGAILFYLSAWLMGTDLEALVSNGWLLGPFPGNRVWEPIAPNTLVEMDWQLILWQLPVIGTLAVVSVVTFLLHASGLELATRKDINLNHELSNAGLANMFASLSGGPVGFYALSVSVLIHELRAPYRITSLFAALFLGIGLFFGFSALGYLPRPVLAGLLLFLAFGLLLDWVIKAAWRLPIGDYIVVLLILLTASWVGFLEAIGVGIVAGMLIFTVNYARVEVIKDALSGANIRSNIDRAPGELEYLEEKGDAALVLRLQGYLFFGSANKLLEQVQHRVADVAGGRTPLRFLCLDFNRVNGVDTSAVIIFRKLDQLADSMGFDLIVTDLSPEDLKLFEASDFNLNESPHVRLEKDLDHGLEWCEEKLIAEAPEVTGELQAQTELASLEKKGILAHSETVNYESGDTIIQQGTSGEGLFFILSGRVNVFLEGGDTKNRRLRAFGAGTLVGEVAVYTGGTRTASVFADGRVSALRITKQGLEAMSKKDPEAAAYFHEFVATQLAKRLTHLNRYLESLR